MAEERDPKKPKQRHRLLVNPQELGLTARIKTALLQQDMGITQRIKKAVGKTQDKDSFFEMKKVIFGVVLTLLFFCIIFAYMGLRSRTISLAVMYPDNLQGKGEVTIPFYTSEGELEAPAYERQVVYERTDVYGKDLLDSEYEVYSQDNKVQDKHKLKPGTYKLKVKKDGYKPIDQPVTISDKKVTILVTLQPTVIPKRRLVLHINDPLFNKPIEPDDVVIVGEKNKSIKNTLIRSGSYVVRVIKEGYEPQEATIEVPDDGVVKKKITLQHKYRPVRLLVDDGVWEEGKEPVLKGEEVSITRENEQINYRDTLLPGIYTLEIDRDGYKQVRENITIYPGETLDIHRIKMSALPRKVLVQMNYDVIPPDKIAPDKKYLIDLHSTNKITIPITEETVAPGNYNVVVEKAGYKKYSKPIFIEPNSRPYIIKSHMVSVTKYMLWKIFSDFDVDPTPNPDEMDVVVDIRKKGYKPVENLERSLPAQKLEIEVRVDMETIPREVIPDISADNALGVVTPDVVNLSRIINGNEKETVEIATKAPFKRYKPGRYRLRIRKVGYEPIDEEIIIFPDDKHYVIKKELVSIRRELVIDVTSDYDPDNKIKPDSMLVNRKDAEDGYKVKPGKHTLVLNKAGYYPIEKVIDVTPGSEPFIIKGQFAAKPREVQFQIFGGIEKPNGETDFTTLTDAKVTVSGNEIRHGDSVPPKKVNEFRVEREGFEVYTYEGPIEPSEDPYILKTTLKPKTRRVILHVTATFPKGIDLMPLDTSTLGNETIQAESSSKPGNYELVLGKTGYETIAKTLNIEPSEEPFRIIEIMKPKKRALNLDITYDVPPQNSNLARTVRLKGETIAFDKVVKTNDEIDPHNYRLEVVADGYERVTEAITIDPAETSYLLKKQLVSLPRQVIFRVTSDYDMMPNLQDYQILVDGDPVENITKIKPGTHTLVINKAGFHSINDEFKLFAGTDDFVIQKQMVSMARVVRAQITDIENNNPITPDIITLGDSPVTGNAPFKPKRYRLVIKAQGYSTLTEDINIEPGATEYVIERQLSPSERLVKTEIKGDYNNDLLNPKVLTLNDEDITPGASKIRPGGYDVVIYVPGYEQLTTRIQVNPSQEDYIIRQTLVSKARKLVLDISDSLDNSIKITPNKVAFNGKETREGEEIKPGQYQVQLEKEGYDPASTGITVEPSEEAYTLKMAMDPRARRLNLVVDGDYRPGVMLNLDDVLVDGKEFLPTSVLTPGERSITLKKEGYEDLSFSVEVSAGTTPFLVKKTMISKPREVAVKVTHDFMAEGDDFTPELLTLGERDIVPGEKFKPSSYELIIAHPGFAEIREKLEVEPGVGTLELNRELIANRRRLNVDLTYDVEPPQSLSLHKIRLRSLNDTEYREVKAGDMIIPGEYQVQIEKEAYELYNGRAVIVPDDRSYKLAAELIAKYVQILVEIKYDIEPGDEAKALGGYEVTFISEDGIGRSVQHGNRIKPGNHKLEITRPGYDFRESKKVLRIRPSEQPYWIRETLNAKPRSLSFGIFDAKQNEIVEATQVLVNGTIANPNTKFDAGVKYGFIARFKEYKTVDNSVTIEPGEGPFAIKVDLTKYKKYQMSIGKKYHGMVLDSIKVPIEIFVDGDPLEPNHINPGDGFNLINYDFYAPKGMRSIRVVCGFYFDESLVKERFEFRDLRKIDTTRLLEHLRGLAKSSPSQALRRVVRLLRDRQDKYKVDALPKEDRQRIANLLRDLTLSDEEQKMRKTAIKKLQQ
ncbi:PEGA domain-containing protein [Candidatus Uabimicrobium sp. HlEnr_7]|uniref:PEGA domain-containing protein n=1 Tax=Candidatus Uabimicrobium helgolandensis TaxID=3095367 RepID=UPI0035585310